MVQKNSVFVSAPGKIILSGEHSVVYGQPAVLAAVNRRLFVKIETNQNGVELTSDQSTKLARYALGKVSEFLGEKIDKVKIEINSEIPVNRGMGSSAALSVAMVGGIFRWLNKKWDKNLMNKIAFEIEKKQHGRPSGGDNTVSLFGGMLVFQKKKMEPLRPKFLPSFVLLDSGRATESTAEMVAMASRQPASVFAKMKKVTVRLIELLRGGQCREDFKNLISENERLLEKLGVVGKKAQKVIQGIEDLGGAAKVCGAGGITTGSGILLAYHREPEVLLKFARQNKISSYQPKLGEEGLRNEN